MTCMMCVLVGTAQVRRLIGLKGRGEKGVLSHLHICVVPLSPNFLSSLCFSILIRLWLSVYTQVENNVPQHDLVTSGILFWKRAGHFCCHCVVFPLSPWLILYHLQAARWRRWTVDLRTRQFAMSRSRANTVSSAEPFLGSLISSSR